jgi:hypothetical protein
MRISTNRSARSRIFCIIKIPENKLEYQEAVYLLLTHSKQDFDSVTLEVSCDTLIVFGVSMQEVTLIKVRLS